MRDQIRNFAIGAGLAAMLWAPLLKAQDATETAEVPFDFHVNNVTLPAGQYTVMTLRQGVAIQLRNDATGKSILFMPPGREYDKKDARLTFHRYGDDYFLSEIWIPNAPAFVLRKSKLETEASKNGQAATMAYVALGRGR